VNEDFKLDVLVDLIGSGDGLVQLDQRLVVVVLSGRRGGAMTTNPPNTIYYFSLLAPAAPHLCIDDEDEGSTSSKNMFRVEGRIKEVDLTGEVPDL